jgi:short-chain fatty acids transporter
MAISSLNMMQPFWALPLLGITGLKAKDTLPYIFILMFIGLLILSLVVL